MPRARTFRRGYYLLDGDNNAIQWPDQKLLQWAGHFEALTREGRTIVKQEAIGNDWLSTVFLGLDHNHFRAELPMHKPHIFETMAFRGLEGYDPGYRSEDRLGEDFYCQRWSTWDQALKGHEKIADDIRAAHRNREKNQAKQGS